MNLARRDSVVVALLVLSAVMGGILGWHPNPIPAFTFLFFAGMALGILYEHGREDGGWRSGWFTAVLGVYLVSCFVPSYSPLALGPVLGAFLGRDRGWGGTFVLAATIALFGGLTVALAMGAIR